MKNALFLSVAIFALLSCGRRVVTGKGESATVNGNISGNFTAIDISANAVAACKLRGINDVRNTDILELEDEKFDTIILLMNGTGIFGKL